MNLSWSASLDLPYDQVNNSLWAIWSTATLIKSGFWPDLCLQSVLKTMISLWNTKYFLPMISFVSVILSNKNSSCWFPPELFVSVVCFPLTSHNRPFFTLTSWLVIIDYRLSRSSFLSTFYKNKTNALIFSAPQKQCYASLTVNNACGLFIVDTVNPSSASGWCLWQMALETDAISQGSTPFRSNHWCSMWPVYCVCVCVCLCMYCTCLYVIVWIYRTEFSIPLLWGHFGWSTQYQMAVWGLGLASSVRVRIRFKILDLQAFSCNQPYGNRVVNALCQSVSAQVQRNVCVKERDRHKTLECVSMSMNLIPRWLETTCYINIAVCLLYTRMCVCPGLFGSKSSHHKAGSYTDDNILPHYTLTLKSSSHLRDLLTQAFVLV